MFSVFSWENDIEEGRLWSFYKNSSISEFFMIA